MCKNIPVTLIAMYLFVVQASYLQEPSLKFHNCTFSRQKLWNNKISQVLTELYLIGRIQSWCLSLRASKLVSECWMELSKSLILKTGFFARIRLSLLVGVKQPSHSKKKKREILTELSKSLSKFPTHNQHCQNMPDMFTAVFVIQILDLNVKFLWSF